MSAKFSRVGANPFSAIRLIFTVDIMSSDTLIVVSTADCCEFYQGPRSGKSTRLVILTADCGEFHQGLNSGEMDGELNHINRHAK